MVQAIVVSLIALAMLFGVRPLFRTVKSRFFQEVELHRAEREHLLKVENEVMPALREFLRIAPSVHQRTRVLAQVVGLSPRWRHPLFPPQVLVVTVAIEGQDWPEIKPLLEEFEVDYGKEHPSHRVRIIATAKLNQTEPKGVV